MTTIDPGTLRLVPARSYRPRITAAHVKQHARAAGAKRLAEVDALVDELVAFGRQYGYNPDILLGMTNLETDTWRSPAWEARLNPGGIGITDQHDFELGFATGTLAARAMAVHFMAYAKGVDNRVSGYIGLDPRFVEVHKAGFAGVAKTLADLGNGRWATDPDYAAKVAGRIADLAAVSVPKSSPVKPTPQKPKPATSSGDLLVDLEATEPPPVTWVGSPNYWGRAVPKPTIVMHHITDARIPGTSTLADIESPRSWLKSPLSQASCHILIDRDGTSYQLVSSGNAAWTNGDVQKPRTDMPALTRAIASGLNLNHFTFTLEYHGLPEGGITEAQLVTGARWANYACNRFGISRNRAGHGRHADANSVTRAHCPGDLFPMERLIVGIGGDPANITD